MKSYLLFYFLLVLIISSCIKSGTQNEYLLSDEMKDQNPFLGGEKLYFWTDSSEQIIYNVNARDNKVHKYYNGNNTNIWDLYEVERMNLSYDQETEFHFEMLRNGYFKFKIDMYYKDKRGRQFEFRLPLNRENEIFIDSLFIREILYRNIYVCEKDTLKNKAYRLYYTTENGIIKVDFSDNSSVELDKIEW